MVEHLPRAFPLGEAPPVGTRQSTGKRGCSARGHNRACGLAYAKGVGAASPGAGTSTTARIRNAGGRSAGGWRGGGKPDIARTSLPKPGTPRQRKRTASESSPRLRPLKIQRLRRRVVTQQKFFFPSVMRSARLPRTPRELAPQSGTVLLPPLPAGRSQCPRSGTQVALSRHLGWAEEAGHRVPSRTPVPRFSPRPHP